MTRKEAREEAFRLLFEKEFHPTDSPSAVYVLAAEDRELPENDYIKTVYFGVCEHQAEIDELIARYSKGWKTGRITPVSRSAIRLCIYEMLYMKDIPTAVSINEAVELVKQFDDQKMRSFVNGLLNSAKNEIETQENQ